MGHDVAVMKPGGVDRTVVAVVNKRDQARRDLAYWLSRPMAERIAAVEVLRQQAEVTAELTAEVSGAPQGLQRVCRVTQRRRG